MYEGEYIRISSPLLKPFLKKLSNNCQKTIIQLKKKKKKKKINNYLPEATPGDF